MKSTRYHFKYFVMSCKKWIKYFGLHRFEVFFEHENVQDSRACVRHKTVGKIATISLSVDWPGYKIISNEELDKVAFHEILELLLSRLSSMCRGYVAYHESAVDEEIHVIIRTLENTLFEKINGRA